MYILLVSQRNETETGNNSTGYFSICEQLAKWPLIFQLQW